MPHYQTFKAVIKPQTAFISPLVGDMLFGQVCATLAQGFNHQGIHSLLQGYTAGKPFLVISDAFPTGFLPKPKLPIAIIEALDPSLKISDATTRKAAKRQAWIPSTAFEHSHDLVTVWKAAVELPETATVHNNSETHNSINRMTHTTGEGEAFAPYSVSARWYSNTLDIYCVLDTERFNQTDLNAVLTAVGQWGYGKDATVGKGKFEVVSLDACDALLSVSSPYRLTLAACAPQGLGFDGLNSFYMPVTRYPRHGSETVHTSPYKTPLLLADTAAIFTLNTVETASTANQLPFIGQGLGGVGRLTEISQAKPETVHQGYAPCIALTVSNRSVFSPKV